MKTKSDATQVLVVRQLEELRLLERLEWDDIEVLRACVILYAYKDVLSSMDPIGEALDNLESLINEDEQAKGINPVVGISKIEIDAMRHALSRIKRIHETKTKKAVERTPGYLQLGF